MNPLTTVETIQLILAPVVMISSCALLLTSLGARYSHVLNRLHTLAHEQFDLLQQQPNSGDVFDFNQERLQELDIQLPGLLKHHRNLHNAILLLYLSITLFLGSMFALACAAAISLYWMEVVALLVFLAGVGLLFAGISLTALDFRTSHCLLQGEVRRLCRLRHHSL